MPAELDQVIDIAIKAEEQALDFHDKRIFLEDLAPTDPALHYLVEGEEFHMELLGKLKTASDPVKVLDGLDMSLLDAPLPE